MSIVYNDIVDYFAGLTATSAICTAAGDTFTAGTNLFQYIEPPDISATCLTIIPYGAGSPSTEGDRQEAGVQIRMKAKSLQGSFETQQSIINRLHDNTAVCSNTNSRLKAVQSVPLHIGFLEGGEYKLTVSNFIIKYIKL